MKDRLLSVFQETLFQSGHTANEIAKGIKKPYSTLMRECNPYDKGAKLGAMTLFEIMSFTKNVEPLREMAHQRRIRLLDPLGYFVGGMAALKKCLLKY